MTTPAEPATCPACGTRLVPVLYGMPSSEAQEAQMRGVLVLGGCTVFSDAPTRACPRCGLPDPLDHAEVSAFEDNGEA